MAASLLLNADLGALRVRVFGAMAASEAETARRLDELAAAARAAPTCGRPCSPGSYREAKRFLFGLGEADEEDAGHPFSKSEFFAQRLPAEAIDALIAHLRTAPAAAELDFSPWGGAYTRVAPEATAFAHRNARFLLKQAVVVDADAHRRRSARRRAIGSPARGSSRTRSGPGASIRTSPIPTSTTGTPPTTAPTASACSRSSAATTPTASSARPRAERSQHRRPQLHPLGPQSAQQVAGERVLVGLQPLAGSRARSRPRRPRRSTAAGSA